MSDDRVPQKSKAQIAKETLWGVVFVAVGAFLIFRPPDPFGVAALYVGALMVGTGGFISNKKILAEWMAELRELAGFWRKGP